jgi:hypothetical protein
VGSKTRKNKTKIQHNICWTHCVEANTYTVIKTIKHLQAAAGKDEPNIVFIRKL